MGVEGGTRFIPEAALGCQETSCFLLNAFQLGWLQAWGGQVIYSNTQWNQPAGTWTGGFAAFPGQSTFCFLLSASSLNCTQQPAGCVWCSPSSQLSPLRTGRRGMLQVKSQCSGSAASGKLLHACSKHTVSGESQNEDSYTHMPRLEKEKLSSHFSFACWFFFPFLFVPFILSLSYQYSSVLALSLFPTFSILFISPLRYHSLLLRADERRRRLLQRYNEFLLAFEAGDMLDWIQEKKAENTGVELDDVWELQKKFDEFQMVRKSCLL